MSGIQDVELTSDADSDLDRIGGTTEKDLFGKLQSLGDAVRRGETRELDWHEAGNPQRFSWRVGAFAVVYYERVDSHGRRIAVVEGVVLRRELGKWAAAKAAAAKRRDDAIAAQERGDRQE